MKNYEKLGQQAIGHLRTALNQAEMNNMGESLDATEEAIKKLRSICDWR